MEEGYELTAKHSILISRFSGHAPSSDGYGLWPQNLPGDFLTPRPAGNTREPADPTISRKQCISDNKSRGNQHPQDCWATDFDKLLTWSCLHCGCVWVLVYGGSSLVPTSPVPAEGQRPLFSRPPAAASKFHPARRSLLLTNWKRRHIESTYSRPVYPSFHLSVLWAEVVSNPRCLSVIVIHALLFWLL